MTSATQLTPETTVNEAIALRPSLLSVFSAYGIDACCGGALPIREAARRHQIDLDALIKTLTSPSESEDG